MSLPNNEYVIIWSRRSLIPNVIVIFTRSEAVALAPKSREVVAEVTQPRSGAELTELVNTAAFDEGGLEEMQVRLDEVF